MNCNSRGQQTTQMSTDRGRRKTLGIHMMEYDTVRGMNKHFRSWFGKISRAAE